MTEKITPISLLQEVCQQSFWAPPVYATALDKHLFITNVYISSLDLRANGYGRSKKMSKQQAATRMLNTIKKYLKSEKPSEYLSNYRALLEKGEEKSKKSEWDHITVQPVLRCDECVVSFANQADLNAHFLRKRHALKENAVQTMRHGCSSNTFKTKHHFCSQCGARCTGTAVYQEDSDEHEYNTGIQSKIDMLKTRAASSAKLRFEDGNREHLLMHKDECAKISVGCQTELESLNRLSLDKQEDKAGSLTTSSYDQTNIGTKLRDVNCLMPSANVKSDEMNFTRNPLVLPNINRTGARPKRKVIFASNNEESSSKDFPMTSQNTDHSGQRSATEASLKIINAEVKPMTETKVLSKKSNCVDTRHIRESRTTFENGNCNTIRNPTKEMAFANTNYTVERLAKEPPIASGNLNLGGLGHTTKAPMSLGNRNQIGEEPVKDVPIKSENRNLRPSCLTVVPILSEIGNHCGGRPIPAFAMESGNTNIAELQSTTEFPMKSQNSNHIRERCSNNTSMALENINIAGPRHGTKVSVPSASRNHVGKRPATKAPESFGRTSRGKIRRIANAVLAMANASRATSTSAVRVSASGNANFTGGRATTKAAMASGITNRAGAKPAMDIPTVSANHIQANGDMGDQDDSWDMASYKYSDKELQSFVNRILKEIDD